MTRLSKLLRPPLLKLFPATFCTGICPGTWNKDSWGWGNKEGCTGCTYPVPRSEEFVGFTGFTEFTGFMEGLESPSKSKISPPWFWGWTGFWATGSSSKSNRSPWALGFYSVFGGGTGSYRSRMFTGSFFWGAGGGVVLVGWGWGFYFL